MDIGIGSRRLGQAALAARFPGALLIDVTSRAEQPWVRFSPFYPHGGIPVPLSPGLAAASVEGIWQGLKVFARADVDPASFANETMRGLKRTSRRFGAVLGHRAGLDSADLLGYAAARRSIYLPAYRWVLDHRLQPELAALRQAAADRPVALLDYETNADPADLRRPLSHAALIIAFLRDEWPGAAE